MNRIIKFEDLLFEDHEMSKEGSMFQDGKHATLNFDNGYGVSVVTGSAFYTDLIHPYELAVLKNGKLHYDNSVADGDVRGHLSQDELMELVNEVANFKKDQNV